MAEEDLEIVYEEASDAMEKSIKSFRKDLLRVRTGRASTALLDDAIYARDSAAAGMREAEVAVRRAELDLERSAVAYWQGNPGTRRKRRCQQ